MQSVTSKANQDIQWWQKPVTGNVTAVAIGALTFWALSDRSRVLSCTAGFLTACAVKIIHMSLFEVERGMSTEELKQLVKDNMYALYALKGIRGKDADNKVEAHYSTVCETTMDILNTFDKKAWRGKIKLPNGNWNNFTLHMSFQGLFKKISVGSSAHLNNFAIDIDKSYQSQSW
jgi:hypothetical protein